MNLLKLHTETELQAICQYSSSLLPSSSRPFDFTSTPGLLPPPLSLLCLTDSSALGVSSLAERVPRWWNSFANCSHPFRSSPSFPVTLCWISFEPKKVDLNLAQVQHLHCIFILSSLQINAIWRKKREKDYFLDKRRKNFLSYLFPMHIWRMVFP